MMNILIFIVGLVVYAGYGLLGLGYILAATLISYGAGLLTPKHRWVMWPCVAANAAWLVLLKLQPMTGMSLISAMGVSYFTLQIISYNVDVYQGKYEPERNIFRYALFVTYLPHLFIGPIERYDTMRPALFENRRVSWDGISLGAVRAVWGLLKKYVIAARLGVIIGAISADTESYRGAFALAAMVLYSLQLYSDFSGGMDMVLGVSRMLGVTMRENFDAPYLSQSFQEFWRRWHMTLGAWLRSYVYIPLGGNRKGKLRKVLNTLVTFLVSGLWHGVHYLLWGLVNGIFVCFGEKLKTRWKLLNQAGVFILVSFLWSFFVWPDTMTALSMIGSVFTTFNYGEFFAAVGTLGLTLGDWIVVFAALMLLWGYDCFRSRVGGALQGFCPAVRTAVLCALALLVLIFGMYGIGFNAEAFIYSKF